MTMDQLYEIAFTHSEPESIPYKDITTTTTYEYLTKAEAEDIIADIVDSNYPAYTMTVTKQYKPAPV